MTLEELAALESQATPGPWSVFRAFIKVADGSVVAKCPTPIGEKSADALLIAASRNALPALLKVAEAARDCVKAFHDFYDGKELSAHTPVKAERLLIEALAALDEVKL